MTQDRVRKSAGSGISVCQIISCFHPVFGGAERATESLACELRRMGADVVVLTRHRRGLPRREHVRGIPVHRLGLDLPRRLGALAFVLHSLLALLFAQPRRTVVHVQHIDAPILVGILAKLLIGRKVVVTLHGRRGVLRRKARLLGRLRLRSIARLADRFVAITDGMRSRLLAEGVAPERIWNIPNGIDIERFRPATAAQKIALRRHMGYGSDCLIAVYAGRLVEFKRVDLLIESWAALARADSARLLIVGDGPKREQLRTLADARGLGNSVDFVTSARDVLPYYQASDIFVLPSLHEELSVALLEAMACGLCVVAAGSPGNLAVIQDGVNGLVFPTGQAEPLRERLAEALGDAAKREVLQQAARRTVEHGYTIQAVARAHLEMYRSLVGG